ncbi:hypothetical protein BA899_04170 [Spiribacter sp. SSL99]|uniref:TonB-dependent receptor plug domain-containing protein n=1 Tax=Spiribacter sp. SSL99 TaxID=1866884 RepID=UPI00133047AD|nr:TonB-dependent receptor [Spiribacter sp. SSL99]KAF0285026.1 hypothetical protein BA899_04170 [Spiribacter sp. SSL99]
MNKAIPLTALALAAGVSTNVYGQTSQTTELEPIIVSGGISPVAADEFGRSNTVITRRDIEDSGYATVQQALEAQPGVSINGTGPNDRQIRIRGGEGNHTLVLIDGVRAASGDNEFVLRGLDTSYIQRIEILRGPQSVPYGTDAATGVVNIITREAGEGVGFGASAEFGEGDRQSAYVTRGTENSKLSLSLSNLNDEGYDFSGSGGEKDGTRWESAIAKGAVDLSPSVTAGFSFRIADAKYDFDETKDYSPFNSPDTSADDIKGYVEDDPNKERNLTERAASSYIEVMSPDETYSHKLRADQTSNLTDNSLSGDTETDVFSYRFQAAIDGHSLDSSSSRLSFLVESRTDETNYAEDRRTNDSLALEYSGWATEDISLQLGVRYNNSNKFSNSFGWSAATSYYLEDDSRLHFSAGQSTVYPVSLESEFADVDIEKNRGFDIGFEKPVLSGRGVLDITYFKEVLVDKIVYPNPYSFTAQNLDGDTDRQGVELQGDFSLTSTLTVGFAVTHVESETPDGKTENRRPRNEVGINALWELPAIASSVSGNLRYVNGLYDNENWKEGAPQARLPDFTVVNLAATHSLTDHVDLTARITNALDEDYQEVLGFATRDRAAFVGIRTSW